MALPNYSPSGTILLGCVPWDSSYSNVRLYSSVSDQYTDIASMMTITTSDYVYIGRNRTLKVSVHADRLYHVNYCAYRNESLTDGWIYCFVTDVAYINDQTTELTLETDIFQTYLYGTDWTIPPCFIERMTVPSEDYKYLITSELDIPLITHATDESHRRFGYGGLVIMTAAYPDENNGVIDTVFNPNGYLGVPARNIMYRGCYMGSNYYYCHNLSAAQFLLDALNKAGSIESVTGIFTLPDFTNFLPPQFSQWDTGNDQWSEVTADTSHSGFFYTGATITQTNDTMPDTYSSIQGATTAPARGSTVGTYTPKNKKLLYYPYTKLLMTDYDGSTYEYRYDLFPGIDSASQQPQFRIKYIVNPRCEALVYPTTYAGASDNLDYGFVTKAGAMGSFSNNQYQTFLGQHGGAIVLGALSTALMFVPGGLALSTGAKELKAASGAMDAALNKVNSATTNASMQTAMRQFGRAEAANAKALSTYDMGANMLLGAGMAAGQQGISLGQQISVAGHQPTVQKGNADYSLMFQSNMQGVHFYRMQVIESQAMQIDEYFTMFGYSVERVESPDITSRPYFNYLKTVGATAKSYNTVPSAGTPHSRGRGCPSDVLAVINARLDSGCTFWHTTTDFGDYSKNNALNWS